MLEIEWRVFRFFASEWFKHNQTPTIISKQKSKKSKVGGRNIVKSIRGAGKVSKDGANARV